jgi:hypothetical protein
MLIMPMVDDALARYIRDCEVIPQCTRGAVAA